MTMLSVKRPERSVSNSFLNDDVFSLVDNLFRGFPMRREFASFVPSVNISENEKSFELHFSAPGFNKEDFKIELEKDVLSVSAEMKNSRELNEKNYKMKEFSYGSFNRKFQLPELIDADNISAQYENGILNVELPKKVVTENNSVKAIAVK